MDEMTIFRHPVRNTEPWMTVSLGEIRERIFSDKYHGPTEELRGLKTVEERRRFKGENLDYVTFSGVFRKRCAEGLVEHSGYICLDFDHVQNFKRLWNSLKEDTELDLCLMFRSPSGDGIKAVFWVGEEAKTRHRECFEMLRDYVSMMYGEDADKSGKDVCRPCFLCCDPNVYYKPKKHQQL